MYVPATSMPEVPKKHNNKNVNKINPLNGYNVRFGKQIVPT